MIDDLPPSPVPPSPVLPCGTPVSPVVKLFSARPQCLGGENVLLTTSQPHHHLRNLLNRLRMCQRPSRPRHAPQSPRNANQSRNRIHHICSPQITFFHHHLRTHPL